MTSKSRLRTAPEVMTEASSTKKIARFGVFEADLVTGELRRDGVKIRLQEQPFQVLAILLERPGEMVTREELQKRLWPADTFVDFDHSLNTAVNKLREALSDAAANPRFVQTVARRGYRFLAPVLKLPSEADSASTPISSGPVAAIAVSAALNQNSTPPAANWHPGLEIPVPRRGLTRGLFGLIQIMYLIFYILALVRLGEVHRVADSAVPGWGILIVVAVLVSAGIGIPLRFYLLSAVAFDHGRLGEKFKKLFPAVLALDQLWAIAPFLSMELIGFGGAFAACAGLLYIPFAERTLIRMAYGLKSATG